MRKLLFAAVLAGLALPVCLWGAEMRVGFVNASAIFEQFSAAKEAQQAYEKEMADLGKQVEAMEREIKAFTDTLETRKYLFSEDRLREKQQELEKRQADYVQFRQDAEARAAKRNEELTKPIVVAIEDAAKSVAEKEGFDLVLDSAAGIVVYSKPELDLTDRVLQSLEQARQAGQTQTGQTKTGGSE
jgi:outer membrane protein